MGNGHLNQRHAPFESVSHVSMLALGIGVPSVLKIRPSTYMYSPLPSEAIDSPNSTVREHEHTAL